MNLRSPDDIEVRGRKLREILARHEKWLASEFREGQRAYLSAADLRQVDLSDQDLRLAQLAGANLTGADLSRTKLKGAVLNHAILRDAILNSADLGDEPGSKAEGGQGDLPAAAESKTETSRADWGGADLTLARLPAGLDRWLRLVIVTPDMHRVHHSAIRAEHDSNYGFNFSVWDRIFGTYTAARPPGGACGREASVFRCCWPPRRCS